MFENKKQEDYMGKISWSRVMCSHPQPMFGTEIKTSNPVKIEITNASEERGLNRNWFFTEERIVELEMTPIQWAEFLTSGNTEGVPCTLKFIRGQGILSEPKVEDVKKVFNNEVEQHFDEIKEDFSVLSSKVKALSMKIGKTNTKELEDLLYKLNMNITSNMDYIKKSFKEEMTKMVGKAKAEFNAFIETRVHEIGIEELKKGNVSFLEDKKDNSEE